MRKMRLFQKDAYISIDFLEKKTEVIKLKGEEDKDAFSFDIDTPAGKRTIAIANPPVPEVNAIQRELEEFVQAIRANDQPVVNEIDGYRALEVAHQILQKISTNRLAS
jgi:predicted dehydrogenase